MTARGRSWGAIYESGGRARFRLWAPSQGCVLLVLGNDRPLPMTSLAEGWHEAEVAGVMPGTPYRFCLEDGTLIADPASSAQQGDVFGPSLVIDHARYRWHDQAWGGRPWHEAVIYEIHIGTFTPQGTFRAAIGRLDALAALGITAIEIMPLAQFPGRYGWGYDGVLHYAPHNAYGPIDDLKALVDAAHARGIMVILDVVYNHFGPSGNFLGLYAPSFFDRARETPWGAAVAFDQPAVRRYFIENALAWIGDYHFDGLRLDATEQMIDDTDLHVLEELATEVRQAFPGRYIHLVTEDPAHPELLRRDEDGRPLLYTAVWNHDLHHVLHVVATGESEGYFAPFADDPWGWLQTAMTGRAATSSVGTAHGGGRETEPLRPSMQVNFLQTHDQVGNRAFGERLAALIDAPSLHQLTALLLLSPQVPLLFMGEEYGDSGPFHFFLDYDLATSDELRESRMREAMNFGGVAPGVQARDLPDPSAISTFEASRPDWTRATCTEALEQATLVRDLIALRQAHVAPLLARDTGCTACILPASPGVISIDWTFGPTVLRLRANFLQRECAAPVATGRLLYSTHGGRNGSGTLPPKAIVFVIGEN